MAEATPLKARLAAGESPTGMLVRMPCEVLIELAGAAGFDFVLIDCEHGPSDQLGLQRHIDLARLSGMSAIVRTGRSGSDDVLRALESGAEGVVVPHVESVEEAEAAVAAARLPPLGDRGFAQFGRAGRHGAVSADEQIRAADEHTLVVAMVETLRGVEEIERIARVPGIDAIMSGPADLSVSMGLKGGIDEPDLRAALDRIAQASRAAGRAVLTVVSDVERAKAAEPGLIVYNISKVLLGTFLGLAGRDPSGADA